MADEEQGPTVLYRTRVLYNFFSVAVLGAHLYGDSGRMERNEAKIEVGCGDSALGSLL
jgi:hypothetical protein